MWKERYGQRDLFEEAIRAAELRPDLRAKLTPLLQALLSEAAGLGSGQSPLGDHLGSEEVGDDENNA